MDRQQNETGSKQTINHRAEDIPYTNSVCDTQHSVCDTQHPPINSAIYGYDNEIKIL